LGADRIILDSGAVSALGEEKEGVRSTLRSGDVANLHAQVAVRGRSAVRSLWDA